MNKNLSILSAIACVFLSCAAEKDKEVPLRDIDRHDKAVHIKDGWIRDPYIVLGPDGMYYLTGTTYEPNDPREYTFKYKGTGEQSGVVGHAVQLWRSPDLLVWDYLGAPYTLQADSYHYQNGLEIPRDEMWAPELHWAAGRWVLVHCPAGVSNLALTEGTEITRPWANPNYKDYHFRHDPSLFKDDDGRWYMLWGTTTIARLKPDFAGFDTAPKKIDPANRSIGHEGATMRKIGSKYVLFGTGWSTDEMRKGSYNLYYCTADSPFGPFSDRRFAGRFLGHGTPFRDKQGRWWCTAFYNADVPPVLSAGIETRDLSQIAQTINDQGTTIVPLEVKVLPDGDVSIRALDARYATPGPDEMQKF